VRRSSSLCVSEARQTASFGVLGIVALAITCAPATAPASDAAEAGSAVVAAIVRGISAQRIEQTIRKLASFETRHTLSETASDSRGIGAARRWIKSELERCSKEAGDRLKVEFDEFLAEPGPRIPKPATLINVVATLPGEQPESRSRIYVVSGHYDSMPSNVLDPDSRAPGANDDASGTAAAIEMACVMAQHKFDATLVFMAVAGEEQGLIGSSHWAKTAKEKGLNIAAMITNDIIGSPRADDGHVEASRVRLFAEGVSDGKEFSDDLRTLLRTGGENDTPTRQLARFIKENAERNVPGMTVDIVYRRDRYLRGGDHFPFLEQGYAAVRFTEPNEDFRHQHQNVRVEDGVQYGDLPEFVDFAYVANVARVNAAALAALALGPAVPRDVQIETIKLENDTTLRWSPNTEADIAGYRVLWRATTAPFWQGRQDLGMVTRTTIKGLSKDNLIFAVQAVDSDGNTSVASYPRPYRPQLPSK
jgi:hypothetical protein